MDVLGVVLRVAAYGVLAAALGVAAVTDLARRVVPNGCVVAVAVSGAAQACAGVLLGGSASQACLRSVCGLTCALVVMLATAAVSARIRGTPGVGGGDVKLLAVVGVWVGPARVLVVIALSCLVAVAGWVVLRIVASWAARGNARASAFPLARDGRALAQGIPLAPAIALSALVMVLLGGASYE
ncbi:prepilin peptidase [Thermophilibacter immobilis]|uniref:Prepilin peptidase n=1 Tax=Thermophilibacter immobilis TaxID=2779519 RepID=A0A7S7M7Y9_9ACTN|nr:A24 family peptidase; A24 family peptidase; prepilin peptidase [Thermophilibacter immobilis]QOY60359.1 prepilin peptidase [Thermophilibacter immobilis]